MKLLRNPLKTTVTTKLVRNTALTFAASMALAENKFAQGVGNSPWENAVQVLQTAFTGLIATGLALVAIVVGGLVGTSLLSFAGSGLRS
ncbi:MAG: TrbC/VirB2 family protein [Terriglobia bacterium]